MTTLLTGATGFVGRSLLPELAGEVVAQRGEITLRGLGLDPALRRSVTAIIHCAAETSFTCSLDHARLVNVRGTENVIEFARGCPRLEKLSHVSTAYVAGLREGVIPEGPVVASAGFANVYQQTKAEAENVVFDAMADLPASIYRMSTIIGDAATGRVEQFNFVHQLLRLVPRNILPMLPGDPDAPIDLIPREWAIATLARLLNGKLVPGSVPPSSVRHICAGREHSPTVGQLCEWAGGPGQTPRMVRLDEWRAYVADRIAEGDRLLTEVLRALDRFVPHLAIRQEFETGALPPPPPIESYFGQMLDFCRNTWSVTSGRTKSRTRRSQPTPRLT